MGALIIERESLPSTLSQYFDGSKICVEKKGRRVILSSSVGDIEKTVKNEDYDITKLWEIFSGNENFTVEKFLEQRDR